MNNTKKPVFNADAAEEYFSDLLVYYRNTANDIFRRDNDGRHASEHIYSAEYQKYVGMQIAMREVLEYFSKYELCEWITEIPTDRLRELVDADREGRCVVLPCKVGNTVYRIGASLCKWREIDRCDEYCDGWQYRDCWDGTRAVLEEKFNLCDIESVGKTVFLTREAAETALKGERDEIQGI